jgi:hypothetical protein
MPRPAVLGEDASIMSILRTLIRQRGYVSLALATLTLAVGANLVVLTIVNALWLRARPVKDPDRVVWVTGDAGSLGSQESSFLAPLGREPLGAWFFSGFGLVALLLGIAGVFGLVAYVAESRRREMGVRMALGAAPRDLIRLSVMTGVGPVLTGVVIGPVGSAWLARFVESLLFGVGRLDRVTYAGAGTLMLVVALAAG